MRSRTGPCSMWSSRYAAAFSSCLFDSFIRSRSTPCSARASGSDTPSLSFRSRTSSGSRTFAVALDPKRLRPNLAPSSSAQSTSPRGRGGGWGGPAEPPPVGGGFFVPAEEDGPLRVAGGGGPEVTRLVALDLDAVYLFELALEPVAGLDPLVRPGHPAGTVGAACEVGELLQLLYGAAGVHVVGVHQPTLSGAATSASASSKTFAASSAASRVMVSGGEIRIAFAFMPPLPTRTPRSRLACRKRAAADGFGSPSGPTISRASIRPRPRTSPTIGLSSAIFARRSFR